MSSQIPANKTTKNAANQALIQFLISMLISALAAGLVSIGDALNKGPINWSLVALSFGLAFAFSVLHSLAAFLISLPPPNKDQAGQHPDFAQAGRMMELLVQALEQQQKANQQQFKFPVQVEVNNQPQQPLQGRTPPGI